MFLVKFSLMAHSRYFQFGRQHTRLRSPFEGTVVTKQHIKFWKLVNRFTTDIPDPRFMHDASAHSAPRAGPGRLTEPSHSPPVTGSPLCLPPGPSSPFARAGEVISAAGGVGPYCFTTSVQVLEPFSPKQEKITTKTKSWVGGQQFLCLLFG